MCSSLPRTQASPLHGNLSVLPWWGSGPPGRYLRSGPFQTQPHLFARCPDWWGPPALRIFSTNRVDETLVSANGGGGLRSEEHTSELQSLMRISYAVFCLKKKITKKKYMKT